jgi:uncharacterized protein
MAASTSPGPFGRLAALVLTHRAATLVVVLIAVALAVASATRIRLDFSSAAFYGADDPAAAELREFQARWGPDDATLYVLAEADGPAGVLEVAPLQALAALRAALLADPDVLGVRDLDAVMPSLGPGEATLATSFATAEARTHVALRGVLLASPVVPRLLSADGRQTLLAVELRHSSDDVQAIAPVVERLRAEVTEHEGRAGLRLELAGVPAIRASFYRLALHDQLRLGPLVALALCGLLALAFRRVHGVIIPLVLTALPVVGLVGLMAATGEPIGLLNQAYFTLLPVIAVSDAVHLQARLHEILRRTGADPRDPTARRAAVIEACDRTGVACLLTTVTTALGFASLVLAQMPMLRRFGLYAAIGIALAYVALLLIGPLLLDAVRARPPAALRGTRGLARWTTRRVRPSLVVGGTILLGLVAALGAQRVVVDNHLSALLPADDPVRQASARIDESLTGTLALEVELQAEGPWLTAPHFAPLAAFERWAAAQPEVRVVTGPATLRSLLPSPTDPEAPPEALALRHALLDEGPRTPPGVRSEQAAKTTHRARVSIHTADLGGRAFAALAERVRLRAAELPARVLVTGTPLLAYEGVNRIAVELRRSLVSVVVVITLAIAVLLRSAWLSLLALVPNVLPPALAYGALGLLGIELDPLAAVILCVALGLAVDDSLHLLARLREGQAAGLSADDALEQAVEHSGHAALVTSVALCGGLLVDLFSSFPPLRLLGGLGAATLALAWVFDVVMLPGLLRAASRRRDVASR